MNWYITPEDLKGFTLIPQVKNLDDSVIQQKIEIAQFRIEAYCNQSFSTESKAIEVDGSGSNILSLDKRVHKINSLFFDFRNWVDSAVISDDGWKIKLKQDIYSTWMKREDTIDENISKFKSGIANVLIDAEWGWENIPNEVLFCMKKLTEAYCLFAGDTESLMAESGIYKKQTIGGYSYELKDTKDIVPNESTGDPTVDTILKKFKRSIKRNSLKVGVV